MPSGVSSAVSTGSMTKAPAKVELEIELCVERRAERTRQSVPLTPSHATEVHGTSCRAERETCSRRILIGGSAAPATPRAPRRAARLRPRRPRDFEARIGFEGARAVILRLATLGSEQVRVRGLLDRNRSGAHAASAARVPRKPDLRDSRWSLPRGRRSPIELHRRARAHADAQKEGRRFLTASCSTSGRSLDAASAGPRGNEPRRELLAQRRVFAEQERARPRRLATLSSVPRVARARASATTAAAGARRRRRPRVSPRATRARRAGPNGGRSRPLARSVRARGTPPSAAPRAQPIRGAAACVEPTRSEGAPSHPCRPQVRRRCRYLRAMKAVVTAA